MSRPLFRTVTDDGSILTVGPEVMKRTPDDFAQVIYDNSYARLIFNHELETAARRLRDAPPQGSC